MLECSWGAEIAHVDPQPFLAFVDWLAPPPSAYPCSVTKNKKKNRIDRVLRSAPQLLVQQKGVASRRLAHLRQVLGLNASPEAELVSRRVEKQKMGGVPWNSTATCLLARSLARLLYSSKCAFGCRPGQPLDAPAKTDPYFFYTACTDAVSASFLGCCTLVTYSSKEF